MSIVASLPLHVSPSVRKALGELSTLLEDYHYSQHARESICAYVAREGTVTGAPGLDAEDEADASWVFENELEPVPFDSEAWDRDQGVIFDVELLIAGNHPWPLVQDQDDDRTRPDFDASRRAIAASDPLPAELPESFRLPSEWNDEPLPPIRGGSDEAEPFEPGPDDLADYAAWSEELDRRRRTIAYLDGFNAVRNDAQEIPA